jgi:small subunit ribosomal protein S2
MSIIKKNKIDSDEMMKAGVHLGHRVSRLHPKMKDYIFGVRNTIHIIDLEKTVVEFEKALNFIKELVEKQGTILLVGTKTPLRKLTKDTAIECDIPYVNERWLGGTFTNFKIILKRIKYFRELVEKKKGGELDKYTKKERVDFDKELKKLEIKFGGIKDLDKIPEAVFICDVQKNILVAKEARAKGIKIIAIVDTNIDPNLVDYAIPANDDAITSVRYILDKVKDTIISAKSKKQNTEEKQD